jgi:rsbT co-antagonist protein RsbR
MTEVQTTNKSRVKARNDGRLDFWTVYDAQFDAMSAALTESIAQDPDLGPLIRDRDQTASRAQARQSHELMRRALLDGEWEAYETTLQQQGATYARAGLPLATWTRLVSMLRTELLPHLVSAYATDPGRLAAAMHAKTDFLDRVQVLLSESYLRVKEEVIRQQAVAIKELSTPVLRVRDRLLLMPIIGVIDTVRARQLTEALLQAIHADRARAVVIDITGVPAVDSRVAQHLVQAVGAARLMGTGAIVTGLSPAVAQSLVALGLDLSSLTTVGDLQGGLEAAERLIVAGPDGGAAVR